VNPRSEPLLWLQLIALGAMPLELLLLLLLLAGADPGPLAALERLLGWSLGVLAPALLFWRQPPDCCSLLLVQVPAAGRTPLQRRLSTLPRPWPLRLALPLGMGLLLVLLWRLDAVAALATPFSPLQEAPRLVSLLLAAAVLALLLWQWLQLVQAFWLLSRPAAALEALNPAVAGGPGAVRPLALGVPLLLLDPLVPGPAGTSAPEVMAPPSAIGTAGAVAGAIQPEQAPEDDHGTDLDQQVGGGDALP